MCVSVRVSVGGAVCRRVLACVGVCWRVLACVGVCWRVLACDWCIFFTYITFSNHYLIILFSSPYVPLNVYCVYFCIAFTFPYALL
jgi:hypothetical protein